VAATAAARFIIACIRIVFCSGCGLLALRRVAVITAILHTSQNITTSLANDGQQKGPRKQTAGKKTSGFGRGGQQAHLGRGLSSLGIIHLCDSLYDGRATRRVQRRHHQIAVLDVDPGTGAALALVGRAWLVKHNDGTVIQKIGRGLWTNGQVPRQP